MFDLSWMKVLYLMEIILPVLFLFSWDVSSPCKDAQSIKDKVFWLKEMILPADPGLIMFFSVLELCPVLGPSVVWGGLQGPDKITPGMKVCIWVPGYRQQDAVCEGFLMSPALVCACWLPSQACIGQWNWKLVPAFVLILIQSTDQPFWEPLSSVYSVISIRCDKYR